jgi:hypothetical protein
MVTLGGGTMIPLCLVLIGSNLALMLGAGMFFLLGSLVMIKIPHAFG